MKSLTVAYVTSRDQPHWGWFIDSLLLQVSPNDSLNVIAVATGPTEKEELPRIKSHPDVRFRMVAPKPTIWQGPRRITKEDWWAKSNALNTAICLCETEWIAFVDDRSVLMPNWLDCIYDAMNGDYAVCGNYEKRRDMKVVGGVISDPGITLGADHRTQHHEPYRTKDWYGGHGALPLEWCLAVNGFAEKLCDGLSSEDSVFGICLRNKGFPICYDSRMKIIEDRTPGEIDGALKRADKGLSPNDKSHKIIEIINDKTTSQNDFDIRNLRDRVLNGEPFPEPCASHYDWYDGQSIAEMI